MDNKLKYEQVCELFGDDIGELVDRLLSMDTVQFSHERVFLNSTMNVNLSVLDEWILTNIGLPEWVSPHLNIELTYCKKIEKLILAEQGEDVIFLDKGKVFLKSNDSLVLLNSTLVKFLKSIILHQNMIDQTLLIFGANAYVDNKTPDFFGEYFIKMFNYFDDSSPDGWIKLAGLSIRV